MTTEYVPTLSYGLTRSEYSDFKQTDKLRQQLNRSSLSTAAMQARSIYKSTDFGSKDMYKQSSCDDEVGQSVTTIMRNQVVNLYHNLACEAKSRSKINFDSVHMDAFMDKSKFANKHNMSELKLPRAEYTGLDG